MVVCVAYLDLLLFVFCLYNNNNSIRIKLNQSCCTKNNYTIQRNNQRQYLDVPIELFLYKNETRKCY